jgi:hypothetical protein
MIRPILRRVGALAALSAMSVLSACGGSSEPAYSIGGMAVGVNGPGLVLRNNGTDSLSVPATGGFTFATRLPGGASYAVTVTGHPAGQTCSVANASGVVAEVDVTQIAVACVAAEPPPPPAPGTYTVGGDVSGLRGTGLVLTYGNSSGSDDLAVTANGAFVFGVRVADGMPYAVSVATQPSAPTQNCTVANASGTVARANVANVLVTCADVGQPPPPTDQFTIGGRVNGLSASGLVLHNNGGDAITVQAGAGSFSFPGKVARGSGYHVTVATQPGSDPGNSQDCAITNGTGTANADVTDVEVTCGPMGPLAVRGVDPVAGATDVSRAVRPSFNFSSSVAPETVGAANLRLLAQGIEVEGARSVVDSRVTLTPARKLLPLTDYTFVADAGIGGRRGELLGAPVSSGFTTRDGSWRALNAVGRPEGGYSGYHVALPDAAGNLLVAWVDDSLHRIEAQRYDATTATWTGPASLFSITVGQATALQGGVDSSGNAVLVWRVSGGGSPEPGLWAVRFGADSQQWAAPQRIVAPTVGGAIADPRVAVGLHGHVAVLFGEVVAADVSRLFLTTSTTAAGAAWTAPVPVEAPDAPTGGLGETHVATSAAGETVVVWARRGFSAQPDSKAIWARRYLAGTALEAAAVISLDRGFSDAEPGVAVDVAGGVHVVWREVQSASAEPALYTYRARGGGWTAPTQLSLLGAGRTANLRIATHRGDTGPAATWVSWAVLGTSGRLNVAPVTGGVVGALHTLAEGLVGVASAGYASARLGVDPAGNVLAVWPTLAPSDAPPLAPPAEGSSISVARYSALRGVWTTQPELGSDAVLLPALDVTVSSVGDAVALWLGAGSGPTTRPLRLRRFE